MIIAIGWAALGLEALASIVFGIIFWRLWSNSAMERSLAVRATLIYAIGCLVCLGIAMFVPL